MDAEPLCRRVAQIQPRAEVELSPLRDYMGLLGLSERPKVVGSAALHVEYIGDVDLFDQYYLPMERQEASHIYARMVQSMVRGIELVGEDKMMMTDFKAGLDPRFADPSQWESWLVLLGEERWRRLIPQQQRQEEIRHLRTLRWSSLEISRGRMTRFGREFTLHEAIQDPTLIKCDVAVFHRRRYFEMTCVYNLRWRGGYFYELPPYLESVKADLRRFHATGKVYKLVKRLWLYHRLVGQSCLILERLGDFLDSSTNALGSAAAALEVLLTIPPQIEWTPLLQNRVQASLIGAEKLIYNNVAVENIAEFLDIFEAMRYEIRRDELMLCIGKTARALHRVVAYNSRRFLEELRAEQWMANVM